MVDSSTKWSGTTGENPSSHHQHLLDLPPSSYPIPAPPHVVVVVRKGASCRMDLRKRHFIKRMVSASGLRRIGEERSSSTSSPSLPDICECKQPRPHDVHQHPVRRGVDQV